MVVRISLHRYISGLVLQHCQLQRTDSSRCLQSLSGRLMILTSRRPTLVSPACISRSTPRARSSGISSSLPSRLRTLDLFKLALSYLFRNLSLSRPSSSSARFYSKVSIISVFTSQVLSECEKKVLLLKIEMTQHTLF